MKKQIKLSQKVEFLSTIETKFIGVAQKEVKVGNYSAIVPEISTLDKACFITGFSTYVMDEEDPLGYGLFKPIEPF
ncbi:MAG: proline racemase family protein [Thermoplasmataceae archaeon]